eukprot:219105-Karenia_brevis.AAC.1
MFFPTAAIFAASVVQFRLIGTLAWQHYSVQESTTVAILAQEQTPLAQTEPTAVPACLSPSDLTPAQLEGCWDRGFVSNI